MPPIDPLKPSVEDVDFVHTGPATLAGRYMRRFWQPVYENGVDQAHVPFTHAKSNFTKFGLNWDIPKITAEELAKLLKR